MPANAQFVSVAERLIAFNTVSRNSNLELIAAAKETLASAGATIRFTYDRDRSKANLFATIGPEQDGGLVLSGHTDVVPVDGQEWSSDPFTPVIREGQLYGRGAADMKGFLAVALALAPEFAALDLRRPPSLHQRQPDPVRQPRCRLRQHPGDRPPRQPTTVPSLFSASPWAEPAAIAVTFVKPGGTLVPRE